jgi:hypothetical protein
MIAGQSIVSKFDEPAHERRLLTELLESAILKIYLDLNRNDRHSKNILFFFRLFLNSVGDELHFLLHNR